jgi:hypothetical protein
MRLTQVVPAYLVGTCREHRFEAGIDTFFEEISDHQLVDKEGGGMARIRYQALIKRARLSWLTRITSILLPMIAECSDLMVGEVV